MLSSPQEHEMLEKMESDICQWKAFSNSMYCYFVFHSFLVIWGDRITALWLNETTD